MSTRVILSASHYADYCFPVGIAALLWREVVGYEPLVFLFGNPGDAVDGRMTLARDFMNKAFIDCCYMTRLADWPVHVSAQNSRYHAAALHFADDLWLVPSDADLFPLRRDFYHQHEDYEGRFVFYYANGDHYVNYPTCHIAARTKDWRDIMEIGATGDVMGQMRKNLEAHLRPQLTGLPPSEAGFKVWMNDMWDFSRRIKAKPWHPAECRMIEREGHPPKDRLDRSNWPAKYDVKDYTDAHILRATHEPENWKRTRPIVEALIPQHLERIDRYVEEFRRS